MSAPARFRFWIFRRGGARRDPGGAARSAHFAFAGRQPGFHFRYHPATARGIDTASRTVKEWIPLPAGGYGSASTSDGRWLLIAVPGANQVAAIDLRTLKVVHTIDVPKAPQEVLIRPDGRVAYASCDSSHQVAEIDLAAWKVNRLIDAGGGVDGLAWAAAQ